jgi:hypothetical protein
MEVLTVIKHIEDENKNNDNFKAYIVRNESLLNDDNVINNKKRFTTRHLRDWIQCDGYPSLT